MEIDWEHWRDWTPEQRAEVYKAINEETVRVGTDLIEAMKRTVVSMQEFAASMERALEPVHGSVTVTDERDPPSDP